MSASLHVPKLIRVDTAEEIPAAMLRVQTVEAGRVHIISINYDPSDKTWVVFYYPIRSVDGGVF